MPADSHSTVDLTNCDREPIHLLGAVQPFGFLIGVSRDNWDVTHVSTNTAQWLGASPAGLIGRPLHEIFCDDAIHAIRGNLQSAVLGDTVARAFDISLTDGLRCDVAVHIVGDTVLIECERSVDEPGLNAGALVRGMMARLQQTGDQRAFFRVAAREMRALTGFDRVMVYRFDDDDSGEVVAEFARGGLELFLGLHYPASDIPQQARLLYRRNWLRIIPDIVAPAVPVTPPHDADGNPLDLSMSVLRSVSSIHIEYLQNMGVGASMSISIIEQSRLWGLFACHHYSPHHVPFTRRTAAELYGQIFSLMIENREREGEGVYEARAQKLHNQLVTVMANEDTHFESIVTHLDDIADLLTCDGVGIWVSERPSLKGLTPDAAQFAELVAYLNHKDVGDVYACNNIHAEFPPASAFAERAAGMMVVPLSRPARDYLVFFRKEIARTVTWAGDPAKPVAIGPFGDRLTPRKSFELWKETVSGHSQSWLPVEKRIAEALRVSLLEVILRLSNITELERRRAQERQELLIAELNHRVRNILSLIRGVISQSRDSANTIDSFTKVVGGRIHALARAHDQITADNWGPAPLRTLIMAEAGAYLGGKADRVIVNGPHVLLEPQAFTTVALVIHEMMTNSAKYGALSDNRGKVEIATEIDSAGHLVIHWSEHGGPPVKPPTRRGFGSTVIERSIYHDLKGKAELEFKFSGVVARFVIPSAHVRTSKEVELMPDAKGDARVGTSGSVPADVLLVEDNLIIALDTEDTMLKLGVKSVRTASGVDQALKAIAERTPDFAILDVNLGNETSFEIAERLMELGVAYAFATGYGEQLTFPAEFTDAPKLRKPYTAEILRAALQGGK